MGHRWTPEAKVRQAQLIRTWAPWACSTGPRSAEGKARASHNANKPDSINRQLYLLKLQTEELIRQAQNLQKLASKERLDSI
jgi:hypothetical protein